MIFSETFSCSEGILYTHYNNMINAESCGKRLVGVKITSHIVLSRFFFTSQFLIYTFLFSTDVCPIFQKFHFQYGKETCMGKQKSISPMYQLDNIFYQSYIQQ